MPFPNIYAQARIVYATTTGVEEEVVCWYVPPNPEVPVNQDTASAFANALDTAVVGPFKARLPNVSTYIGIACRLSTSGITFNAIATGNVGPGGVASDAEPSFVATVLTKKDGTPGRSGEGRWFVGQVCETLTNGSLLSGGGIAAEDGFRTSITTPLVVQAVAWVPAHRSRKNDTLNPIISSGVRLQLASQRRRELRSLI